MKKFAPFILRIGLATVFLWFGFSQLSDATSWERLIPSFMTNITGLEASTLVLFNGAFEVVFGFCLLLGFFTRIVSLLLALHMFHITLTLFLMQGIGAIVIRDFGLSMASLALYMLGDHIYTIDTCVANRKSTSFDAGSV